MELHLWSDDNGEVHATLERSGQEGWSYIGSAVIPLHTVHADWPNNPADEPEAATE